MNQVSYIREYWTDVFLPFIHTYESGIATPNPDVYCNSFIKFNRFRHHVLHEMGFDYMATGHYAQTTPCQSIPSQVSLLRGIDSSKDQTYFLSTTPVGLLSDSSLRVY